MTVSSHSPDGLRARVSDQIEETLVAVAILLTLVTTVVVLALGQASLLLLVVWVQGGIVWAVHTYNRRGREHLVRKLRVMLQDRVNNQLTVLVGLTDLHLQSPGGDGHDDAEIALTAARAVSREIETLSLESLQSWEARYSQHLPGVLR